jgi:dTDP-4-dehydrorhamnose reductase
VIIWVNGFHMLKSKKKIVFTGGNGRFGKVLQKKISNVEKTIHFPSSQDLDILNTASIKKYLKLKKPKYLIHAAGLSRPMNLHDKNISKSIDLNIIGTANITKVCSQLNIKLIYFSTSYVYPGEKNNYSEEDSLKPLNNYGLSKLGGEAAVQMYKNSLILRISMTEKPFIHKSAFNDFITNFIFHEDVVLILFKILDQKGIINIGGKPQSVYKFAKKFNPSIKKESAKKILGKNIKINVGMNINKLTKILND